MSVCYLSSAYLPPVEYFSAMLHATSVVVEQYDHYTKQTYRNRCRIATSGGVMTLSVPVEKPGNNTLMKDVKISEHSGWQQIHWRAIEAAYNSSPFFEYYKDDFSPFYEKKWVYLQDYNQALLHTVNELLDVEKNISLSSRFELQPTEDVVDLRDKIHPKKQSPVAVLPAYYQVFESKTGFIPGLSIIDLLFNMGNESVLVLNKIN